MDPETLGQMTDTANECSRCSFISTACDVSFWGNALGYSKKYQVGFCCLIFHRFR